MRRSADRIPVEVEVELTTGNKKIIGTIKEISRDCICITTSPIETDSDFSTGAPLSAEFQTQSGEMLKLYCRTIWSKKDSPEGHLRHLYLSITDIPAEYEDFFNIHYMHREIIC